MIVRSDGDLALNRRDGRFLVLLNYTFLMYYILLMYQISYTYMYMYMYSPFSLFLFTNYSFKYDICA